MGSDLEIRRKLSISNLHVCNAVFGSKDEEYILKISSKNIYSLKSCSLLKLDHFRKFVRIKGSNPNLGLYLKMKIIRIYAINKIICH